MLWDGLRTVAGEPPRSPGASDCPLSRAVAPTRDPIPASVPQPHLLSRVQVWSCSVSSSTLLPSPSRVLRGSLHSSPVPGGTPASSQLVPCEILHIQGRVPDASVRGAALQSTRPAPILSPKVSFLLTVLPMIPFFFFLAVSFPSFISNILSDTNSASGK